LIIILEKGSKLDKNDYKNQAILKCQDLASEIGRLMCIHGWSMRDNPFHYSSEVGRHLYEDCDKGYLAVKGEKKQMYSHKAKLKDPSGER
jgi:hypothetical protein